MTEQRAYQFPLAELIDSLTIAQIKEVLLSADKDAESGTAEISPIRQLTHDIDILMQEKQVKLTGRMVRLIMLLAQLNLSVWNYKDAMQRQPDEYDSLLERAQELNGLRNHTINLLMEGFGENEPCHTKATFLDYSGGKWYSDILTSLD